MDTRTLPTIGVIGGTGPEGSGLALRWARAGYRVVLGSRDAARAAATAAELGARLEERRDELAADGSARPRASGDDARPGERAARGARRGASAADSGSRASAAAATDGDRIEPGTITGAANTEAVREAEIVVLSVPYAAQAATLAGVREDLSPGTIIVTVVVPLRPPRVSVAWLPESGSAAAEAQALVGPDIPVVAAFQHVSATKLMDLDADLGCDVLVCGDDPEAKRAAMDLVTACGAIGFDAGPLENAGVIEGMTSVLIGLNQRLGVRGAGLRVTNVPR